MRPSPSGTTRPGSPSTSPSAATGASGAPTGRRSAAPGGGEARRWLPPTVLLLVVAVLAAVPLLRTRSFYFWDDSAAVFLPTWRAIGQDLLSGTWPTLRPDIWMGGNWAGEAQFGLWNPVNLLVAITVASLPNLALAAALVKAGYLALLALGTYTLAREYGSAPWPAVALSVAVPFSGFALYYDAATWVAGLMAFAWTPWFWWAARRCARGALNPIVVFLVGYLLITNGNPYGALAAVVVLAAVVLEALLAGNRAGVGRLVVVGACVGATAGVAYLPLVLSADAGWRESSGIANDGFLVPDLSMIAATSSPSALPFIRVWSGSGSTVPIAYTAWFLVPLLPWLSWDVLRRRARSLAGLAVALAAFGALALGPSSLWLFRWPARLLEYVFLVVAVGVAVVVSAGFRTSSWRVRAAVTAVLVAAGAWLAFSATPDLETRHVLGTALALALVTALVIAVLRAPRTVPAVMVVGTGVVLVVQTGWSPANDDVAVWNFPTSVGDLDDYAARYEDPVLQVAAPALIPPEERPAAWSDLLVGSMPAAAGVESSASYTGLGYDEYSATLCMNHTGSTCPEALTAAFSPAGDEVVVPHLVDALRTSTVVVQDALAPEPAALLPDGGLPDGWELAEENGTVTVYRRTEDLPWPESRLAAVTPGVTAEVLASSATADVVRVDTGGEEGALLFARLAWPGYVATVDGEPAEVLENTQGLIEVPVPAGATGAEVRLEFQVPGYPLAIPALVLAALVAVAQGLLWGRANAAGRIRVYPG